MARRNRALVAASSTATNAIPAADPAQRHSREPSPPPRQAFRFFDLPSELRLRIYEEVLFLPKPLDLDTLNHRLVHPRLALFFVSRRTHAEAYPVFYSQTLRLFPHHAYGRFFHTKRPLLSRLPTHYRQAVTTLELRLGPGWSAPPKCQTVHAGLGLSECVKLRVLKIVVEIDPSDVVFTGFRGKNATEETYKCFCMDLLNGLIEQVPGLATVEIDAFPSVKKDSPLVVALKGNIEQAGLGLVWGPMRGWKKDGEEKDLVGLHGAMAAMVLDGGTRAAEVLA